jgi:hypothetical protein
MRKLSLLIVVLFSVTIAKSQNGTEKIEQYCQVIMTPRLLSNKVTIDIDFGEEKSYLKNNRLKTDAGQLRKFNTIVDALNYMGKEGWLFINAYPVHINNTEVYHFAFRKEFPKSDLVQANL